MESKKILMRTALLALLSSALVACSSSTTETTTTDTTKEEEQAVQDMTDETESTTEEMDNNDETSSVAEMIVGKWTTDYEPAQTIQFEANGDVLDESFYGEEMITNYRIEDNDVLVLSYLDIDFDFEYDFDFDDTLEPAEYERLMRTDDKELALANDDYYFINATTLILNDRVYVK